VTKQRRSATALAWLAAGLAAWGCGGGARPLAEVLPAAVNGWQRAAVEALAEGTLAAEIAARGPRQAVRAAYRGTPEVTLSVYEMAGGSSAFALVQSWKPRDNARAFYKGRYFAVAESPAASPDALNAFVAAFERALPE
jgi:hypothetical protein